MTALLIQLMIPGMAKPGRRKGTPSDFRQGFIERTRKARERRFDSHAAIAEALSAEVGRPIAADTYRKWERDTMLPHDLIVPFCDLCGIDTYELMTGRPMSVAEYRASLRLRTA